MQFHAICCILWSMGIEELLRNQLKEMSMRELARKCKTTHTTISEVLYGKRKASREFCEAVAKGLGLERGYVLQMGGYASDESIKQAARDLQLAKELRDLNDHEVEMVRHLAKMLREQRKMYE